MKNKMKSVMLVSLIMGVIATNIFAGTEQESDPKSIKNPIIYSDIQTEQLNHDWTLELGSGWNSGNIRTQNQAYTMVPLNVEASYALDGVSLSDFRQGYTEFFVRDFYDFITQGPESRMIGFTAGPRYNFVQKNWRVIPFIEGNVGVGFTDAKSAKMEGYGQDFCFEFGVGTGFKYLLTSRTYLRVTATYEHFSNAGLSGHQDNNATDDVGARIGIGFAL